MTQSSKLNPEEYSAWRKKANKTREELLNELTALKRPTEVLLQDLSKLYKLSQNNNNKRFDNIYHFLHDTRLLYLAFEKIKPNSGILTPGSDNKTLDESSIDTISKISWQIKQKTWLFKPVRRIYVEKPGKTKKRPLGIPNIEDRIVQEATRFILNTIYEPEFQKIEKNFGFRPQRSVTDAISKITREAQGMTHAIEGDIEQAYDTINHSVLINILKEKINDKKFIRFLKQGLEAGILDKGRYNHTILGVPQGGIASPILFNIYMHKFDLHIIEHLKEKFQKLNIDEGRNSDAVSKLYQRHRSNMRTPLKTMIKIKDDKTFQELTLPEKKKYKEKKKEYKKRESLMKRTKSKAQNRLLLRYNYTRYADDWILFTNASEKVNKEIKEDIGNWLWNNLNLKLSDEKTKVTDIKKGSATFLGFRFKNNQRRMPLIKVETEHTGFTRRMTTRIFCGIDNERLLNRLQIKGFINKKRKDRPIANIKFIKMKPYEIVLKYRQILEGLVQFYYKNIVFKSDFSRYYYYIKYSCLATLANRLKSSISKVILKYGRDLNIEYYIEQKSIRTGQITKKIRNVNFPSWIKLMNTTMVRSSPKLRFNKQGQIILKNITETDIMKTSRTVADPLELKINIRTSYKLKKYCPICGTNPSPSNPLQSHHVKSVRKGKEIGFTKEIMRLLNKKQIVCCRLCHIKIHQGKYDGIDLTDFVEPAIAEL